MIKIKKILTACLVIALIFSLAACGEDSKEKESSEAISNTAKATADSTSKAEKETETPDNTEMPTSTENPTATAGQEDTNVDADSTTEPTDVSTIVPTTNPTKAPTAKPTVAPTTKPTSTTKPTESPSVTTAPTEDSEWGYYGFENLLPAPLPFSDETDWLCKKPSESNYRINYRLKNSDKIISVSKEEFIKTIKEYVQSLEKYGYSVEVEQDIHEFSAFSDVGDALYFICRDGILIVDIYLNKLSNG